MAVYLSLLVLALAVSLDGFGAGIMYGMRKIRIPVSSIAIVAACSGLVLYASMAAGTLIAGWLPEQAAKSIGAFILIAIGIWAVYQMRTASSRQQAEAAEAADGDTTAAQAQAHAQGTETQQLEPEQELTIVMLEIRRLGLIIKILKTPSVADVDRSGVITASEAVLLGIALSLDSFGAGIGAALVGFEPLITALTIAAACGVFIALGSKVGYLFSGLRWISKLSVVPGCILIAMGLIKLL